MFLYGVRHPAIRIEVGFTFSAAVRIAHALELFAQQQGSLKL
jgi:hypothetical protein